MDPVVFDDLLAVEGQPRTVIRIENERVFAILGNDQHRGENETKEIRTARSSDVDQRRFDLGDRLGLEFIEVRELVPGVSIELVFKIIEVVGFRLRRSQRIELIPQGGLYLGQSLLNPVTVLSYLLLEIAHLIFVCLTCDQRAFDLGAIAVGGQVSEKCQGAVVVLGRDRVDLMVVAPTAIDRQTQKALPDGREDIVEAFVDGKLSIGWFVVPDPQPIEAGRNQGVSRDFREFVTGELFGQELVVGLVLVERADDVIAVSPNVRLCPVAFEAIGFAVANHIEPMAGPTFPVLLAGKQSIDFGFPSLIEARLGFLEERGDLGGRRRQTDQVIVKTAEQLDRLGLRGEAQPSLGEFLFDERIDRGTVESSLWNLGLGQRFKRPMLLPLSSLGDPCFKDLLFAFGKRFALRGHSMAFLARANTLEQFALIGGSWSDCLKS